MYVNDLLIRCQELQDMGAGDRTVVDEDGNPIKGMKIGEEKVAILITTGHGTEKVEPEYGDSVGKVIPADSDSIGAASADGPLDSTEVDDAD